MKSLNSFVIKIIALGSMLIDHIGLILMQNNIYLRSIGRISFPLFAFLLVEGFIHTKNFKKYLTRIFLFGLISEIPFDLAINQSWWDPRSQNILFSFSLGLLVLKGISYFKIQKPLYALSVFFVGLYLADVLHLDYGSYGIILITLFYIFRKKYFLLSLSILALSVFRYMSIEPEFLNQYSFANTMNLFAAFSIPIILLYNKKQGKRMKYFFYIFYPAHLLLLHVAHLYLK